MNHNLRSKVLGFWLVFAAVGYGATQEIDFNRDIRPILSDNCFHCHGPDEEHRKANLRLDLREHAFGDNDGVVSVVPNDLGASEAWLRISSDDPDEVMPPPKSPKKMTTAQKDFIRRWIESGAEWTDHWAFVAPEKPTAPKNGIDHFIQQRLQQVGLEPSPEADRRTLIRRLTLDLTGLPPKPEEVQAFLNDTTPQSYETVVDRLLASPHFGERMAVMWLDASRYGDTSVMHADGPRDMWPWRDWVVEAYNRNQPFDEFSIWQIAGDLLPDATLQQQLASGFNRNHATSDEGGAIAEELRVQYVVDRVQTTSNVWLGLSMECAQCHDHKYDPISQREYFQFYAYFNNTTDPGMQTRKGNHAPMIEMVTPIEEEKLKELTAEIASAELVGKEAETTAKQTFAAWSAKESGNAEPADDLKARFANLKHHFLLDEPGGRLALDVRQRKDALAVHDATTTCEPRGAENIGVKLDGKTALVADGVTEYDFKNQLTFSTWIKTESMTTGAVFAKMDSSKQYQGYDLWLEGNRPGIHLVNKWPSNALKVVAKTPLELNKWNHVAITYDGKGKADGIRIYINGEPVEHEVQGNAKEIKGTMKNQVPFQIGGRSTGARFAGAIDDVRIYDRALKPEEIGWTSRDLVAEALATVPAKRSSEQRTLLMNYHLATEAGPYRDARTEYLTKNLERKTLLEGKTTTMVMQDNPPEKMRKTFILNRGAYDQPIQDEVIPVGTPAVLPPLPADAPPNRLGLAQWLFSPEHPLTARVTINQLWQVFFGAGIVSTPADFGAQSEFPTHPELLDWLAVDFRENGWDTKRMIKQMVMSSTYRQASHLRPEHQERDPENQLLARSPRFRLNAEFIRDNALEVAGLLDRSMGGPGVKPYQPPGLWAEVSLGGNPKFVQDRGQKLYRRSLYTYWKRSSPPPSMQLFDAPTRETCVLKRPRTNTPLQALVTMNDVQFVEASRHLAERMIREGGDSRGRFGFQLTLAREPNQKESEALQKVFDDALTHYSHSPESAKQLLGVGESKADEALDPTELAAWTVVANLILNLDETLTRE